MIAVAAVMVPAAARAMDYYVAPTGSDSAAGTMAAPFATVGRGQTAASAGDTVYVRGGVYMFSGTTNTIGVNFMKSGGTNNPIHYVAYPGETPIFDFYNLKPQQRVTGFNIQCNWIHIKGMEIRGVQQQVTGDCWGIRFQGSNNVVEQMNVHHNQAPGVFITSGSNNLVLNCDSHDNYDPLEGGGNGDGFGCHSSGGGNVIRGCRGFRNSDDGYDFINAAGSCTVENSWSWSNGYQPGTMTASGNGAGFKAGGYGSPPSTPAGGAATHNVHNCMAFKNRAQGFYGNHHPGRINFFNNTAFNNPANFNMLSDSGYPSDHVIRNNLATGSGGTISNLNGGTATSNSWNLSVTVSAADFINMMEAEAEEPRQADGSLPNIGLMHLVAGSDLIDKGADVGLPFVGSAPDLGAFEYGATGGTGSAGTSGGGGTTGAGGRGGTTGAAGTAGVGGRGGTTGAAGRGGTTGVAGSMVTGAAGTTGSAGTVGTAGTTGTPGAAGTTGAAGSMVTGTAGSSATGAAGTVATGAAGTSATGAAGTAVPTGTAGGGGSTGLDGSSGCACRMPAPRPDATGLTAMVLLAAAGFGRRRRARRRRRDAAHLRDR